MQSCSSSEDDEQMMSCQVSIAGLTISSPERIWQPDVCYSMHRCELLCHLAKACNRQVSGKVEGCMPSGSASIATCPGVSVCYDQVMT
jgi:hypothetical protein